VVLRSPWEWVTPTELDDVLLLWLSHPLMALRSGLTLFLAALACAAELPTTPNAWPSTWVAWNSTPLCTAPGVCLHSWETQRNGGSMVLERYWNQELVESAIVAFNDSAWRPLLAKLNAGQPITVLAFGSSIVEGHAGCFAVDTEVVHATGVVFVVFVIFETGYVGAEVEHQFSRPC
jgi:hypothetical protein